MKYLGAEQVLFIHARIISETGGAHGLRDLGLLQSAVARPRATFDGRDLYPDIFSKAAALLASLAKNHAFVDGNKRTAVAATGLLLAVNGWRLEAGQKELVRFALDVALGKVSDAGIGMWIKKHSVSRTISLP
jgi:death-on-curing protein